jgi:hypothetical protein
VVVLLGDRLGLRWQTESRSPLPSLPSAPGTHERYVREWLATQAAAGYVEYDAATSGSI